MNNAKVDWAYAGALIDLLRDDEADAVGICCDNADSGPHSCITAVGQWTGWRERSFFGDSVVDCLEQAVAERRAWNDRQTK